MIQQIRIKLIKQAQEEESWIANMKGYMIGNVTHMSDKDAKTCSRIDPDEVADENKLIIFCTRSSGLS